MTRMTPMAAAAKCSGSSLVAMTEIGTPALTTAAASCPTPAKEPGATRLYERPQPAPMKNDPKSFLLCPYNGSE